MVEILLFTPYYICSVKSVILFDNGYVYDRRATVMQEHYRRLERMYLQGPIHQGIEGLRIQIEKGLCTIESPVDPGDFHAAGALHGAALFKLLDDAAYFAASSMVKDVFVVTASFHVHFLRPVRQGPLYAEGRVISRSPRLLVAESVLRLSPQREVARGSGTFALSSTPLCGVDGYRESSDA